MTKLRTFVICMLFIAQSMALGLTEKGFFASDEDHLDIIQVHTSTNGKMGINNCSTYAFSSTSMYNVGDNFSGSVNSYCGGNNESLQVWWTIENSDNGTYVDSGNFSWNAVSAYHTDNVSSSAMASFGEGNYTFEAELWGFNASSSNWENLSSSSDNFIIFSSTSGGGNSSSGCGSDPFYSQVYAYSTTYIYDLGDNFTGIANTYCGLLNESLMLEWSIEDLDNNMTVDSGNISWTGMNTYDAHYINSSALSTYGEGNYSFDIEFTWMNGSVWESLDSDSDSFVIYNFTSGGNNSGGNQTYGCGYDAFYASVYGYSTSYMYAIGDNFSGIINSYCGLLNESMMLTWSVEDVDNNMTVDSGNFTWTGMNTYDQHNVSSTALSTYTEGNYSFDVEFYWLNGSNWDLLDSDSDSFMIFDFGSGGNHSGGNHTGGCGYDSLYASVYAYSDYYVYDEGENFSGYINTYCSLLNESMLLIWSLDDVDNNITIDSGNFTWTGMNTYDQHNVSSTTLANQDVGNYSLDVQFYWLNGSTWDILDSDADSFMIYNYTSGGNNSGGNHTGGCGYDSLYASVYAFSDYYVYDEGENFSGYINTYCGLLNESMMLTWSLEDEDNNMTIDSGNFTWTGMNTYDQHNVSSTLLSSYTEGNYSFDVEFYWLNGSTWDLLDSDTDSFVIWAGWTGGNHTGGNQTYGCGYDAFYASVYGYSTSYMYAIGDNFSGIINSYCGLLNESMMLTWSVEDVDNNMTVDSGNFTWTGMNTYDQHNVSSTALSTYTEGNYSFDVEFYWLNGSNWDLLDSDSDSFMIFDFGSGGNHSGGNNNTGCGYDSSYASIYGYSTSFMYSTGTDFNGVINTYCALYNETMVIEWFIHDENQQTIDMGNFTWTTMNAFEQHNVSSTALSSAEIGNYTFDVEFSWYNGSSFELLDSDQDMFMIYDFGSGGNNTGGNQSGNYTFNDVEFSFSIAQISDTTIEVSYEVNNTVDWMGSIAWDGYLNGVALSQITGQLNIMNNGVYSNTTQYDITGIMNNDTICVELFVNSFFYDEYCVTVSIGSSTTDTDGDGVPDVLDAFPMDANETADNDGDGLGDNADTDDDNDGVSDSADAFPMDATETDDFDGDGVGDNADTDDDGDGVSDAADAFPFDASEAFDNDGDGVGDNADMDDDNDGVSDQEDAFPFDGGASNDTDSDGIADAYDNCLIVFNPNQADADLDGIGTECDPDEATGNNGNNTGGNNTGGNNTGGNNTGGNTTGGNNTGGNSTDTTNWTECEIWEYFNQDLVDETQPGNGCPYYDGSTEGDDEDDSEGLPSVGFFATLTIVGLAFAFARKEND